MSEDPEWPQVAPRVGRTAALVLGVLLGACARAPRSGPKLVAVPFAAGTSFLVHQGPFGSASHSEPGNEYAWDLDVAYGTPVLAVSGGTILDVYEPEGGGGCEERFAELVHNVKIEHPDGTVAQYLHVDARVKPGERVATGSVVAATAHNGFICTPHLHLSVYESRDRMYGSSSPRSLPLRFVGLGILAEGSEYTTP